jgi:hypothetical protein|tara:strand:+ start:1916 stop:2272 length:357 start_codon:yes stop_codon:yes gene_type:complete
MTDDDSKYEVVNEIGTTDIFGNHYIMGNIIKGFPYTERRCPYCDKKLILANAVHIQKNPEHYKAVYIDGNINCPVYDEGAKKCYSKIYYSSDNAFSMLHNIKFPVKRWGQDELYTVYK